MARTIVIQVAGYDFSAQPEAEAAPQTCALFLTMLPLTGRLVHGRCSGEACWIPFGDLELDLGCENHTTYPAPGHLLFRYGATVFASKVGVLAGSHFATVQDGREHLATFGKRILWEGAQDLTFEAR